MPKRASILLAGIALALTFAACGGSGTAPSPTVTPAPPITPNPKDHTATVTVTILGTPAPKLAVEISTPKASANPRPGKPFDTETTNRKGNATFKELNPKKTYCFKALMPASMGDSSVCAPFYTWQTGPVSIGT